MNKEQQIEKDRLIQIEEIDELIREKFHGQVAYRMDISKYGGFNGYTPLCTYDISKALYNAGYRKTFTSDLASDTQKAYKEGYEKDIYEAVEKPVDISKRKYESIDDIVRGFIVKDGKILYVTNILDGCRHEFKDIHEICDELNNNMKKIDRLMELNNHLRFQLEECKKSTVKEFAEKLKEKFDGYDATSYNGYEEGFHDLQEEIDELLKEYENE